MLVAERKTRVYKRNDGGEGKGKASELEKGDLPRKDNSGSHVELGRPGFSLDLFIFYLQKTGD
jgi:hypothetical protein